MNTEEKNLEVARRYLEGVGQGNPEGNLAFFADDVVQHEFPNRLVPQGATRDLAALREAAATGPPRQPRPPGDTGGLEPFPEPPLYLAS
jgi:hypothetical protein